MADLMCSNCTDWQRRTLSDFVTDLGEGGMTPAVVAVRNEGATQWTYAELLELVCQLANGLADCGIGPGSHVALCAAHGPEWIIAALATVAVGAVLVPIDPQSDPKSLAHIIDDCGATLSFISSQTERRFRERVQEDVTLYLLDAPPEAPNSWHTLNMRGEIPSANITPDDIAVMFYTSGTTGMPKGVPLSHRNLLFQIETLRAFKLVTEAERVLLALPLHHVYPFSIGLLGTLEFRGTVVLPRALTGPAIIRALRQGTVTTIIGVPRLFEAFLSGLFRRVRSRSKIFSAGLSALVALSVALRRTTGLRVGCLLFGGMMSAFGPSIRMVVSGGAALDQKLAAKLDALGWTVATGYGLTETSPLLTLLPPGSRAFATVGKPVPGIEIRIAPIPSRRADRNELCLSPSGREEKDGAVGEVQARGPGVFSGYRNLPDKTAAAFTDDGWFRTDDLGYFDRHGYLHLLGRHTTLIVTSAGENIQPEHLETMYARAAAVREAGVLQRNGELCAVVVPDYKEMRQHGVTDVEEAVRRAMADVGKPMPSHHHIAHYVISRNALQRTRLGKIRRAELARRFAEIDSFRGAEGYQMPGPMPLEKMSEEDKALFDEPVAKAVWDLLCERYPTRPLSPDASLAMDIGIDSLQWINVTLDIHQRTGAEITEETTARIETVRDLLNEAVTAEISALKEAVGFVFDDPQRFISDEQRRWLRPLRRSEKLWARTLYALNKYLMQHLFQLQIIGRENLPHDGNFICVPNHMSMLDPFVVAAAVDFERLRRSFWAGWTGMAFANRLFRFVSRIAQVLPIEQDRAAFSSLAMSLVVLGDGKNLIWFPEGERSRDGQLHRFRTGIGLVLDRLPTQSVPMLIEGTFEAMPAGRRSPRFVPLRITIGKPLTTAALEKCGRGSSREERIANALHDAVAALKADPPH